MQGEDAREAGRRLGVDVEVLFAEDNGVLQIQQLFRFVHAPKGERPAALLIHTRVPDGLERVAKNAARAGVGWILLNRTAPYVDALRGEYPRLAIAAVTTDHLEVGRIHARQLSGLCPDGSPVLYVQGPAETSAGRLRLEGLRGGVARAFLPPQGGERRVDGRQRGEGGQCLAATQDLGALPPRRRRVPERQHGAGGQKALGGLRSEWGRLPFLGCDGLPKGGKLDVDEGRLAATVTMPSCASPAVDLAVKWIRTGAVPPALTVLAPTAYPAR